MALWTPANLAVPPRVWWNGDTAVFSGSNLSSWANSGSEGGSATIGGTPTQATLNSLNGVTFDAAGEKVSLTVGAWGSSGVMQFFDVSDPIAFASGLEGIMHRGVPATTSGLTVNVGVEIYIAAQGFAQGPIAHATSGMANTNPYLLFGSVGSTQAIYVNGTAETLDGDTAGGTFPNLASATWDFGEGWDPVNQNGANYQRLLFDYALSTADRQRLEGWAAWKYGLQGNLPGGHPYASAPPTTGYTITADQGAYTLSGQAAGLRRAKRITAAQGSYSLTGQTAGLRKGYRTAAGQGAFSLSGQVAGLRAARRIAGAQGSFTLSGQAATLEYGEGFRLSAETGGYVLAGQDAELVYHQHYSLGADYGAFVLTGQAAALRSSAWDPVPITPEAWTPVSANAETWTAEPVTPTTWSAA